jgi:prolyl 4-hydroxylase
MARRHGSIEDSIYARLARVIDMPDELITNEMCAEEINIVEYQKGQEYTPHFDVGPGSGMDQGARFISALLYLNTPEEGGATSFPASPEGGEDEYGNSVGVSVPAIKGNLMFFYDFLTDGNIDRHSMHAGEPVEKGEKWIGAAWVWEPTQHRSFTPAELSKYQTSFAESLFDRVTGEPLPFPEQEEQVDEALEEQEESEAATEAEL